MRAPVSKAVVPCLLRDYNLLLSMHYSATTGRTVLRFSFAFSTMGENHVNGNVVRDMGKVFVGDGSESS